MAFCILFISLINLAAGYALAVVLRELEGAEAAPAQDMRKPREAPRPAPKPDAPPAVKEAPTPPAPATQPAPTLPAAEVAAPAEEEPQWMEASLDEFKAELDRYREQLAQIDSRMRECAVAPDEQSVKTCYEDLKGVNQQYVDSQSQVVQRFSEASHDGPLAELGDEVKGAVLKQTAQIQDTNEHLDWREMEQNLLAGCQKLLDETSKLVDANSDLRGTLEDAKLEVAQTSPSP